MVTFWTLETRSGDSGYYRGVVHHCSEKICTAKAYLGLKLASTVGNKNSTVGDNKKDFFYVCFQQKEDQR